MNDTLLTVDTQINRSRSDRRNATDLADKSVARVDTRDVTRMERENERERKKGEIERERARIYQISTLIFFY